MLKSDLQEELQEAFELNDLERLSLLEAKWVHRFGLETFPKFILKGKISSKEDLSFESYCTNQDNNSYELVDELMHSENTAIKSGENVLIHSEELEVNDCKSDDIVPPTKPRPINIAPPPRPALSHLRKWLPNKNGEDDIAS